MSRYSIELNFSQELHCELIISEKSWQFSLSNFFTIMADCNFLKLVSFNVPVSVPSKNESARERPDYLF